MLISLVAAADVRGTDRPVPGSASVEADTLPPGVSGASSLFGPPPDSAGIERWASRVDSSASLSAVGRLAIAELWRRAGSTRRALAALPPPGRRMESPVVALDRARILLSADSVDSARAGRLFRDACHRMDGAVLRQLWLDLRGLLTPGEQVDWATWSPSPATCDRVLGLLRLRAWRMALPTGDWLRLHYRRLRHARRLYWLRAPRFTRDLADELGRPDSLELDDRGLLYLRMGAPVAHSTLVDAGTDARVESWVYYRHEGYRLYVFAPVSRSGLVAVGDYRLQESLGPEARPGTLFWNRYLRRAAGDVTFLLDLPFLRGAPSLSALQHASGYDPGASLDAAERSGVRLHARRLARSWASYAIRRIPEAPEVRGDLPLAVEVLRFRDPAAGTDSVWWLAAVPANRSGAERSGVESGNLHSRLAVLRSGRVEVRVGRWKAVSGATPGAGVGARIPLSLPPGRYPYTLVVGEPPDAASTPGSPPPSGNWTRDTLVAPDPSPDVPALSDLALSPDSGGSWTRDGRAFLSPSPIHVTGTGGRAYLYFECYGIPAGERYEVEVRLARSNGSRKTNPFAGEAGAPAFRLRFDTRMPAGEAPIGRNFLRLELADTAPGAYRLGVRVRAVRTGVTSEPRVTEILRR